MARLLLDAGQMTTTRQNAARRRTQEGFTLVELSMVVAIIGVLAVIAVVGYRKYILNAKITEAKNVISAIKIAQEDYRAERGTYADLGETYCPTGAGASDHKVGWNPDCSGGKSTWNTLPVHVSGGVQFKYATVAGTGAFTAPADATWVTWNSPTTNLWYVVMAQCDLDGQAGGDTQLVASSLSNDIFSRNDGQ